MPWRPCAPQLQGGAEILCLCDTNGATYPERTLRGHDPGGFGGLIPASAVGIHCHNDMRPGGGRKPWRPCDAGATPCAGDVAGFRGALRECRSFHAHPQFAAQTGLFAAFPGDCMRQPDRHGPESWPISQTFPCRATVPYVGGSAFAHKGGMHVDASDERSPHPLSMSRPESVGNRRKFLMSEISGKSGLLARIQKIRPQPAPKIPPKPRKFWSSSKRLEYRGLSV